MKIIKFLLDTVIAYIFAILYLIPILNVYLLRSQMNQSKDFNKLIKKKKDKYSYDEVLKNEN
jgi:hypothetical protein